MVSSYDLHVGWRGANETWTEALARPRCDGLVYDLWESLAARILDDDRSRFLRFDDDAFVDLAESATGILVSLGTDHATVSAPYWHRGATARDVVAHIYELADLIARESGLAVYDLQLRCEVDDAQAIDDAVARYLLAIEQPLPVSTAWMAQAHRNQKRARQGA